VVKTKRTLPDYGEPPVTETLLSVQFTPLSPFPSRIFGHYWSEIKEDYPDFEIQNPIAPSTEEFGLARARPRSAVEIIAAPIFRGWYIDVSGTRLIQLQADRFIHNWRQINEKNVYPRYDDIKPRFVMEWQRFCHFLEAKQIGKPEVNQCEVTYINHLEIGKGWQSFSELNKVVSFWSNKVSGEFLKDPESVSLNMSYVMPEKRGRLHITMKPVIRRRDATEILQFTLTARGKPEGSRVEDFEAWYDLGHEWIVRGFTDFTTEHMHQVWRRKQ